MTHCLYTKHQTDNTMDTSSLNDRFRRAMCTLYEMFLTHRGYGHISQVLEMPHVFMIHKTVDPKEEQTLDVGDSVIVVLMGSEKLNIDGVKEMIQTMETLHVRHGVIVYQNSITSSAKKAFDLLYQYRIELFALHELQYDLTKHMYFCPHEKIEDLRELGMLKNQLTKLPRILLTDPVVRYFGFSKNDVLRIRRPDGTLAYRVVR